MGAQPRDARRDGRATAWKAGIAAALLVGLGLGFVLARLQFGPSASTRPSAGDIGLSPSDAALSADGLEGTAPEQSDRVAPLEAAGDSRAAIEAFLAAEASDDFGSSFSLLSAADRAEYVTRAGWARAHVDFPDIREFTIDEVGGRGRRRVARGMLRLTPELDEFIGLVPLRAKAEWALVREADGWRVSYRDSALRPVYPDDTPAAEAALDWARAHQRCREPVSGYAGALLGEPALAADLCGDRRQLQAGSVTRLPPGVDGQPFVSQFGSEVQDSLRVVRVTGADPLRVVLAPLGQQWVVVGVLSD